MRRIKFRVYRPVEPLLTGNGGSDIARSILTEDFPHKPASVIERRVHSPADLAQPERPARAFGAEPGRADPFPQFGRVVARKLDHDLPGLGVVADHDLADPLLGRRGGLDRERVVLAIRLPSFMQAGGRLAALFTRPVDAANTKRKSAHLPCVKILGSVAQIFRREADQCRQDPVER